LIDLVPREADIVHSATVCASLGEHIVDLEPERARCLLGQPAEESQYLVPAVVGAAERPGGQPVPGHIVGDPLRNGARSPLAIAS
jgi:hypothetical protein